jgi:hypothetical protein
VGVDDSVSDFTACCAYVSLVGVGFHHGCFKDCNLFFEVHKTFSQDFKNSSLLIDFGIYLFTNFQISRSNVKK